MAVVYLTGVLTGNAVVRNMSKSLRENVWSNWPSTCTEGYADQICATCAAGYASSKEGCSSCGETGLTLVLSIVVLAGTIVGGLFYRKWLKSRPEPEDGHQGCCSNYLTLTIKVVPKLLSDIRVFIGVYQTLTNMGSTLSIKFPPSVELMIAAMTEWVNIDFLSFSAISCIAGINYYGKLWASVIIPASFEFLIYTWYRAKLRRLKMTSFNSEVNIKSSKKGKKMQETAQAHLAEFYVKQRIAKNCHAVFLSTRKGGDEYTKAQDEADDHHANAFNQDKLLRKLVSPHSPPPYPGEARCMYN